MSILPIFTNDFYQDYYSSLLMLKTTRRMSSFYINDILGDSGTIQKKNSYQSSVCLKRKKKTRTTFTGKQIFELEKKFEDKKYLSSIERSQMAALLTVTETQVKIW